MCVDLIEVAVGSGFHVTCGCVECSSSENEFMHVYMIMGNYAVTRPFSERYSSGSPFPLMKRGSMKFYTWELSLVLNNNH